MATFEPLEGWDPKMTQGVEPQPVVSGWKLWPTVLLILVLTAALAVAMFVWPKILIPIAFALLFPLQLFILAMCLLARKRIVGTSMQVEVLNRAIRGSE